MVPIEYVTGDATAPRGEGIKFIAHIVNTRGGWGAGFVVALSGRWASPESSYRHWHKTKTHPKFGAFELGNVQFVPVDATTWVANMIAQEGYGAGNLRQHRNAFEIDDRPPIRYEALRSCLMKLGTAALAMPARASVHMPRIGCGLAGGKWGEVEPIIKATLSKRDIAVTVYDQG